jgi:hypothetical protein
MTSQPHRLLRSGQSMLAASLILLACAVSADQAREGPHDAGARRTKIGLLPFADATASAGSEAGIALSRVMQAEMAQSTTLVARVIPLDGSLSADDVDAEAAVTLGRRHKVDVVFAGTVVEASTQRSTKGGSLPWIKRQTGDLQIYSLKAHVSLQADLYNVATGERITNLRASADHSETDFHGAAYTSLGSWNGGTDKYFLESPLGKALQDAVVEMVKKVAAVEEGR